MPQTAPLNWLILSLFFMMNIMLLMKKLYFIPLKSLPLSSISFKFSVNSQSQTKKWTW